MNEQSIREQTSLILEAYRELTSADTSPTLSEFLQLRETAIKELASQPHKTYATSKNTIKAFSSKPSSMQNQTPPKEQSISRISTQSSLPARESNAETDIVLDKGTDIQRNEFNILRGITDPWNG